MIKYSTKELLAVWIDSFAGFEYKRKIELLEFFDGKSGIKKEIEDKKSELISSFGEKVYGNLSASATDEYLKSVLNKLEKAGMKAVTLYSAEYPTRLKNTEIPPLVLYAKGDLSLLKDKKFSIVGSRKSLPLSINLAKSYAQELSRAGFTIVTGIAQGVDTAVIESVSEVGGKVISVVAGGINHVFPSVSANLFDKIIKNGLILSEYLPDVPPLPYFFPVRNRIIAWLSEGTLIVNGSIKSGTLYTAEYAQSEGRDLFAVPYSVGVKSGEGSNKVIKEYGGYLTDSPKDVLDFYGLTENKKAVSLTDGEKAVVTALADGELHLEQLSHKLNKQVFEITPLITMLEIKGVVVKNGVNVYGLAVRTEE